MLSGFTSNSLNAAGATFVVRNTQRGPTKDGFQTYKLEQRFFAAHTFSNLHECVWCPVGKGRCRSCKNSCDLLHSCSLLSIYMQTCRSKHFPFLIFFVAPHTFSKLHKCAWCLFGEGGCRRCKNSCDWNVDGYEITTVIYTYMHSCSLLNIYIQTCRTKHFPFFIFFVAMCTYMYMFIHVCECIFINMCIYTSRHARHEQTFFVRFKYMSVSLQSLQILYFHLFSEQCARTCALLK